MWLVIYQGKRISTAFAAIANEILKGCSNVQQKILGLTGQVGTSLANTTPDTHHRPRTKTRQLRERNIKHLLYKVPLA